MSTIESIGINGLRVDLSQRFATSKTVVGSPAAASETIVCQLAAISANPQVTSAVLIIAQVAYTVGTSGTAVTYRIRQGVAAGSGTAIFSSGATTAGITAANLVVENIIALDTAPTFPGQAYSLQLTVTGGAATSTVSAAQMCAIII